MPGQPSSLWNPRVAQNKNKDRKRIRTGNKNKDRKSEISPIGRRNFRGSDTYFREQPVVISAHPRTLSAHPITLTTGGVEWEFLVLVLRTRLEMRRPKLEMDPGLGARLVLIQAGNFQFLPASNLVLGFAQKSTRPGEAIQFQSRPGSFQFPLNLVLIRFNSSSSSGLDQNQTRFWRLIQFQSRPGCFQFQHNLVLVQAGPLLVLAVSSFNLQGFSSSSQLFNFSPTHFQFQFQ